MTEIEIKEIWYSQLALDYSCSIEDLKSPHIILAKKEYRLGRRIYSGDDCFLKILILNGKLVINGENEAFLEQHKEYFNYACADWFFEPDSIRELDRILAKEGHIIADYHHFYLPSMDSVKRADKPADASPVSSAAGKLCWYEEEEIERFRGDGRFSQALAFSSQSPDTLAVTWEEEGKILGMAGASTDSKKMWQVGINVLPGNEHRGLGTYLVTQLKDEILKRGRVPFYGTIESHILSQRVAVGSGFIPAWAELYTRRI